MSVRVLIVDDDADFRDAAGAMLADRGYDVVGAAGTAAEARAAISRLQPDALLLDVHLPDGNGIGFAEALAAGDEAPLVLLTSTDSSAVTPRLIAQSGAAGFIAKTELMDADLEPYLGR
jgi:DNA-binding NarL/FixJ family response regulator